MEAPPKPKSPTETPDAETTLPANGLEALTDLEVGGETTVVNTAPLEFEKKRKSKGKFGFIRSGLGPENDIQVSPEVVGNAIYNSGTIPDSASLRIRKTKSPQGRVYCMLEVITLPAESEIAASPEMAPERLVEGLDHSRVFLGHSWNDFDLDQLFSLYVALQGRDINALEINFGAQVTEEALRDSGTLVLEGINRDQKEQFGINAQVSGNYNDDLDRGHSTTEAILRANSKNFSNPEALKELLRSETKEKNPKLIRQAQLWELGQWLSSADNRDGGRFQPQNLRAKDLAALKQIFYTKKKIFDQQHSSDLSKHQENRPEFIQQMIRIMDQMLQRGQDSSDSSTLQAAAAEIDSDYRENRGQVEAQNQELQSQLKRTATEKISSAEGRFLETATTFRGIKLAAVDLTGDDLKNLEGASGFLANQIKQQYNFEPDFLLFQVDRVDIDQPEEELPPKLVLTSLRDTTGENFDLERLIARLNQYENWHGSRPTFSVEQSQFGGHRGIVATGPAGTSLNQEEILTVLKDLLSFERSDNKKDFRQRASQLAGKLDFENYEAHYPSEHRGQYRAPEGCLDLIFSDDGKSFRIYESDFELYEEMDDLSRLAWNQAATQEGYQDPPQIIKAKNQRALKMLRHYLDQVEDIHNALNGLEDLDLSWMEALDPTQELLPILANISENPTALHRVYRLAPKMDRKKFLVPTGMNEHYAAFQFPYLPAKIASKAYGILGKLTRPALENSQPEPSNLIPALEKIVLSGEYQAFQEENRKRDLQVVNETTLANYLGLLAKENKEAIHPEFAQNLERLLDRYPYGDFPQFWKETTRANPRLLEDLQTAFPENKNLQATLEQIEEWRQTEGKLSIPNSFFRPLPEKRELTPDKNGYINLHIGQNNPLENQEEIKSKGVTNLAGEVFPIEKFDCEIGVKGFLDLDKPEIISELVRNISSQVILVLKNSPEKSKIRILAGRWSAALAVQIGINLGIKLTQENLADKTDRIFLTHYKITHSGSSNTFVDMPILTNL